MSENLREFTIKKQRGNSYNGFTPEERNKKYKTLQRLINEGLLTQATGPCALCGDPDSPVEYHSEDYSEPFLWTPPAMYCLCRHCHRDKLHKRFGRQIAWFTFIAHIRRGGYAKDLKDAVIKREVDAYRLALVNGDILILSKLRSYNLIVGEEWFSQLSFEDKYSVASSASTYT